MVEILNPQNVLACLSQATFRSNLRSDMQTAVKSAEEGSPIMKVGFYTGNSNAYQEITSWTVTANKVGHVGEVSFCSDLPDTARFKVTIGAATIMNDVRLTQDVTLPFPKGATIAAGTKIAVFAKSDGATTIKVNASITGKEV